MGRMISFGIYNIIYIDFSFSSSNNRRAVSKMGLYRSKEFRFCWGVGEERMGWNGIASRYTIVYIYRLTSSAVRAANLYNQARNRIRDVSTYAAVIIKFSIVFF